VTREKKGMNGWVDEWMGERLSLAIIHSSNHPIILLRRKEMTLW